MRAAKKLTSSPAPEFWEYPWLDTPIVTFAARDGAIVRAHVYKPANYRKGGPAVLFVHGAGYLQNVDRLWSYYAREYMFHHLLMERGYLVVDVDYRGSAGYGRDWRTAIYQHMGGKDLDDNIDAARWMVSQYGADPKRLGIYGGSYGGFITLMAMFTAAGCVRGRRGAAAGNELGELQRRIHFGHFESSTDGRASVQTVVPDLLRAGSEGRAVDLPRHGGYERALSGHSGAGAEADRAAQGKLVGGDVSRREPRIRRAIELGGRVQADLRSVREESESPADFDIVSGNESEHVYPEHCLRAFPSGHCFSRWPGSHTHQTQPRLRSSRSIK